MCVPLLQYFVHRPNSLDRTPAIRDTKNIFSTYSSLRPRTSYKLVRTQPFYTRTPQLSPLCPSRRTGIAPFDTLSLKPTAFPGIGAAQLRPPRFFTQLCPRISGASRRYAIHSNRGRRAFFAQIPSLKLNRKNVPPSRKFSKIRGHHHTIPPSASLLKALLVRSDAESV